ncbi:hypothetical protein HMPREF0185_02661 [Brevundimonas diminuta 470-4]|nr:hypothetical protein HMPREF0185_02661 [Brevundimonas diminuta 470-4]
MLSSRTRRPNRKTGTRASGVPAGAARPFDCHDLSERRTAHLSKVRGFYARSVNRSRDSQIGPTLASVPCRPLLRLRLDIATLAPAS